MFLAVSVCEASRTAYYCYSIYGVQALTCVAVPYPGVNYQFGTTAASNLSLGDAYYTGMTGKQADDRYYPSRCFTNAEITTLYQTRVAYCGDNCGTCANPFQCQVCSSSYYLNGTGGCSVCHSCCSACTSAGLTSCSACTPLCQLVPPSTCTFCQPECSTCNGSAYPGCDTCATGFYLQPQNTRRCLVTCPTGYIASGSSCVGGNAVVLDFKLETITPTLAGIGTTTGLNGASISYFPPNFEGTDPIPSKERGYYFSGAQYIQLPPLPGSTGDPLLFPASFTFSAWIRPQGSGLRTLFSKKTPTTDIFTLRVGTAGTLELKIGSPVTTYAHTRALTLDIWLFVGVAVAYDSAAVQTTLTFYYDSVLHATSYVGSFVVLDTSWTAAQTIGCSGTFGDYYSGFIWRVKVSNYLANDPISDYQSPSQPAGTSYLLSPCPFNRTPNCLLCLPACPNGCVRSTDCSLCADSLCDVCSAFTTVSCTTCVPSATDLPPCTCPLHWYFSSVNRDCRACDIACDTCDEGVHPGCLTCAVGHYMQPMNANRCFETCPSGYVGSAGVCIGGNQVVLDYIFDTITSRVEGVNGNFALNGASSAYFPLSFESSDPLPSKHRGYYFAGSQYLQLPPLPDTTGPPLVLTTTLVFTAWIRPQGPGTLFSKRSASDHIFTIRVNSGLSIEFTGGDPGFTYTHSQVMAGDVWVFAGVKFEFDAVLEVTTITCYYDGVQHAVAYTAIACINDFSLTASQTIGASSIWTDYYQGFIYRVKISNFLALDYVADFISSACPTGPSYCLSPCPFSSTPECAPCPSRCPYGCVRAGDCGLCVDELCDYCVTFDTSSCSQCVANSLITVPCQCPGTSFFNEITRACQLCAPECLACTAGTYLTCSACHSPALLQALHCICPATHYPAPHSGHCLPCPTDCSTCSDADTCLSCPSQSYLSAAGKCICNEGYFGTSPQCQLCGFGCQHCELYCTQCFPGYFLLAGLCVQHCPVHYIEDSQSRLCLYRPEGELTATMNVTANTSLELGFSALLNASLPLSAIDLSLLDPDNDPQNFTYDMRETQFRQFYTLFIHLASTNHAKTELTVLLSFRNSNSVLDTLSKRSIYTAK